jgi:hypothetical protein
MLEIESYTSPFGMSGTEFVKTYKGSYLKNPEPKTKMRKHTKPKAIINFRVNKKSCKKER